MLFRSPQPPHTCSATRAALPFVDLAWFAASALFLYASACFESTLTCSGCIYWSPTLKYNLSSHPTQITIAKPTTNPLYPTRHSQYIHPKPNTVDMNSGHHTSHSFNIALDDCYRKLDQASRDLEYHTAHVTAEIDQLREHIRHLKETIPREDEREDRRQLMHRRHTLQIDWVKRGVWLSLIHI